MDGILSFLFFLIVGLYLFGLISRLLLRSWIRSKQKEFEQGGGFYGRTYSWGTGNRTREQEKRPEGEVTIQVPNTEEKKVNKNIGDYVDYEEVKEP